MKNQLVQHKGKEYILRYRYSSDYCEIQDTFYRYHIILVHYSEITVISN